MAALEKLDLDWEHVEDTMQMDLTIFIHQELKSVLLRRPIM